MLLRTACLLFLLLVAPGVAQIPGIPTKSGGTAAAPKEETPEQIRDRLAEWQKEARASLARLEDPAAEAQLPKGIPASALADRRRDLDQMVRTIARTTGLLEQIPEAKATLKEAEAARLAWTGFPEAPPYSILKLDDLVNQREAAKEKDLTFKSSSSTFMRSLDGLEAETKAAEEEMRKAIALTEKEPADEAAKWRLDAARAKARFFSVRALFIRANLDLLSEQATASTSRLALLDRQISAVRTNVGFTDEDLETVRKASDERRAGIRKEITELSTRIRDASTAKNRTKAAFDQLNTESAQANPTPELGVASARLSAAETRLNTLQYISENLESFDALEAAIPSAYENRRVLLQSKDRTEREAAREALGSFLTRLKAWETVSGNEISALNADLSAQDSNASAIPPDDPRQPALADQRKVLWEKQAFLQRVAQTVITHRKNVSRWIEGFEDGQKAGGVLENLSDSGTSLWTLAKRLWSFEVMKFENVRDVAGVPIKETQAVSLGVILSALAFFVVAYMISSRISRRVQRVIVGRGHIAEAQANTLRNWMMIVVGVVLALTTLHFLRIPLTVFAFFGGALAIGLGFGTQTLIKNFISGIIVLFERKIRVGDIVDIGGLAGSISEINTRSSVLRGPDGRETLVPNSVFLENSVTNLTLSNRSSRRAVMIGVAYGSPVSQVITILTECAERHGLILKDPAPMVILQDFADNAILFRLYFWTAFDGKTNPEQVESDVRIMVQKRFEESDIDFPFPQRDLHLKSDVPLHVNVVRSPGEQPPPPKKAPLP
ncbi:mechanosensitive ion channel [Luteolibacter sp. SL250]|uniref:mechanosensitive ion channel domain-containing protein n=1 Tax=Luteolibacter sp. SL250 TaxID=2995170 RepID=UPI00226F64C4|nr:mechanosensitive ion channel domain-containing protein [Luteolibacter sp. SL250]WAC19806.1 mechanosensitive ion channel [Luteolibacter sp. SL250]